MQKDMICGEMSQEDKRLFRLFGGVNGEMKTDDIPVAPGVNVEALKQGDPEPLEVVVEIPASKSKRGWNYTAESLRNIVDAVNTRTLAGFLGHQKPEEVSNQFLPPATHWVGAKMSGETAYFRGVVDADAKSLKRWIKSGRIKQVSIFGRPKIQKNGKEVNVVGYDPLSIDWTPLDRAGMNTSIVAMSGEMWDPEGDGPSGEMQNDKKKGDDPMTPEELLKEMKKMMSNKQLTVSMIAGEMDWKAEEIAGEMDKEWVEGLNTSSKQLKDVKEALGVSGEMDIVEAAKEAAKAVEAQAKADAEKLVGEMAEEKIKSEAVRKDLLDPKTAIGKLWSYHSKTADITDKEKLAGEMDNFLEDAAVKGIISGYHKDGGIVGGTPSGQSKQQPKGLKTKRTAL